MCEAFRISVGFSIWTICFVLQRSDRLTCFIMDINPVSVVKPVLLFRSSKLMLFRLDFLGFSSQHEHVCLIRQCTMPFKLNGHFHNINGLLYFERRVTGSKKEEATINWQNFNQSNFFLLYTLKIYYPSFQLKGFVFLL